MRINFQAILIWEMILRKNRQFINVVPSQDLFFIRMRNASRAGKVPALYEATKQFLSPKHTYVAPKSFACF